jgi:cytochrome c oxidase subunit 4
VPEAYSPETPHTSTAPAPYAHQEHEHSAVPYIVIWLILCALTFLTVMTGKQHLGAIALPLALAISTTKSVLVLLFFMHLWETKGAPRLIIAMSVVFALVLLFFTMLDVSTRFTPLTPAGSPFGSKVTMPEKDEPVLGPHMTGTHKQPRASPWDRHPEHPEH